MSEYTPESDPWAGIKPEDRSGDADAKLSNRLHRRSDVDTGTLAQHHTLGTNEDQAASGAHQHDGRTSKKLGDGQSLSISGTKGSAASEDSIVSLLARFISFTDNRTP